MQLHAAVVELAAGENAEIKYSTVQNWYAGNEQGVGGIYNFVTKRGLCSGARSHISWTQVCSNLLQPGPAFLLWMAVRWLAGRSLWGWMGCVQRRSCMHCCSADKLRTAWLLTPMYTGQLDTKQPACSSGAVPGGASYRPRSRPSQAHTAAAYMKRCPSWVDQSLCSPQIHTPHCLADNHQDLTVQAGTHHRQPASGLVYTCHAHRITSPEP